MNWIEFLLLAGNSSDWKGLTTAVSAHIIILYIMGISTGRVWVSKILSLGSTDSPHFYTFLIFLITHQHFHALFLLNLKNFHFRLYGDRLEVEKSPRIFWTPSTYLEGMLHQYTSQQYSNLNSHYSPLDNCSHLLERTFLQVSWRRFLCANGFIAIFGYF